MVRPTEKMAERRTPNRRESNEGGAAPSAALLQARRERAGRGIGQRRNSANDDAAEEKWRERRISAETPKYRILLMSSRRSDASFQCGIAGGVLDKVSDAEIAQLVSVALEGALLAFGEGNPEQALRLRACEGRAAMREALSSLPRVQATDPTVRTEYRNAVAFQKVTLELALEIVNAIKRYATVYDRDIRSTW